MNILYIVHQTLLRENSGTPVVTDQYANLALKKNCKVCILSTDENVKSNSETKILNGIYYTSIKPLDNWSIEAFLKKNNLSIIKIDLPFNPDIIHIVDWVNINPGIIKYLATFKKPIIRHFCNFEDLCYFHHPFHNHEDNSLCTDEITPELCSKCISEKEYKNKKTIKKIKSFLFKEKDTSRKNYYLKLSDRKNIIIDNINYLYSHLIFPSRSFSNYFFSHFKLKKPFNVIHHGINLNINDQNKNKNNADIIKFIYTGGTAERKGWKIIEEAFDFLLNKYPNKIKLRIYGHKKKTSKSSLKKFMNVDFFDTYKYNELNKILSWADIGILPSHFETFGLIIREYMHNKVIPISSNSFGADELIENDKNGIIIKKNNSKELVNIIEKIINDPNKLISFKTEIAKTKIRSIESEFEEIFKLYENYRI
tara:strand:- start:991 stop:2262 length:1272 start_codon:yes stop_codon:yes gene_type:complete